MGHRMDSAQTKKSRITIGRVYRAVANRVKRKFEAKVIRRIHKRKHKTELINILELKKNQIKNVIIYPPFVDWNIPLYARYHHLAIQLSRLGSLFFYCTGNYSYDNIKGFQKHKDNLYLTNRYDILLEELSSGWVIVSSTNPAISVENIRELKGKGFKIIYDYIDEIHTDISGPVTKQLERHRLISEDIADVILTVSAKLYEEMIERFPKEKVILHQNGVEYGHFHIKKNMDECPEDMRQIIAEGKPIIGYYGALAAWIDYELINYVAENRPGWNIVIIGYDYDRSMSVLNISGNLKYLGTKDYRELPGYGIWFDAAIIPFRDGDVAKSTSPLKLYEYMAMNKPVVVTKDLLECYQHDGILIARDSSEFLEKLEKALLLKDDPAYLRILDEGAKQNTWAERASVLDKAMGLSASRIGERVQ